MNISPEEITEYRKTNQCSMYDAKKAIYRKEFCKELRTDKTIDELADTLIRILEFEFGGYN